MIQILLLILCLILLYKRYHVQGIIKADRVKVIRNWNRNTVTWDEFIQLYDNTIKYNYEILMTPPGFFVLNEAHLIEKVKYSLKKLNLTLAHAYASITTLAKSFDMHDDDENTFFWQCIGKTKWEIDGHATYELGPGDLLVIPSNIKHKVTALTPRLGISMSI